MGSKRIFFVPLWNLCWDYENMHPKPQRPWETSCDVAMELWTQQGVVTAGRSEKKERTSCATKGTPRGVYYEGLFPAPNHKPTFDVHLLCEAQ